ncbi:MAG: hypothetical protein WKF81_13815 [Thermomicrobiales bacterium]
MNNDIPPLAPDDKPFDFDEDEPKPPFFQSGWWVAIAIILVIGLIAGLASPIFAWW